VPLLEETRRSALQKAAREAVERAEAQLQQIRSLPVS